MKPSARAVSFVAYARDLQSRFVAALEEVEGGATRSETQSSEHVGKFESREWQRPGGGGGWPCTLRGKVLEKAAVNVSAVHGESNPLTGKPFFAAGLSTIVHPANPKAPTFHANVRIFEEHGEHGGTEGAEDGRDVRRYHVGGGMDLTPMGFPFDEDTRHFHEVCARAVGPEYDAMKRAADAYFFVKHRNRARGVGGIFFDERSTGDEDADIALLRHVGDAITDAYVPIVARRVRESFTEADRARQLAARGVYVEFNLLYDKGTKFGFASGGDPDAILGSLPPLASW